MSSIVSDIKYSLRAIVDEAHSLSIMSDGSTDQGIIEEEVLFIQYIKNGEPVTSFVFVEKPDTLLVYLHQ